LVLVNGKEVKLAVRKKESLRRRMAEFDLTQEEGGATTIE